MDIFDIAWNIAQQTEIDAQGHRISTTQQGVSAMGDRLAMLERRTEALTTACDALFGLLRERCGVSEEQMRDAIAERFQAQRATRTAACPKCGHGNRSMRVRCMYCGANLDTDGGLLKSSLG